MDAGDNNASIEVEVTRAFKVTSNSRTRKMGIMASSMGELEMKCHQKFKLQGQLSFVLAEDGTEVDFDCLKMIQTDSMLMVLHGEEHWEAYKPESATVNVPDDKVKKREGPEPCNDCTNGMDELFIQRKRLQTCKRNKRKARFRPTQLKLGINSTFEQIETTLKNHYYPAKRSPIGHEKKYSFCVGSFKGEEIDRTLTLGEFVSSKETKARIYLLSKPGLNVVTPPNLQDMPGSSSQINILHLPDIEDMPGPSSQINFNAVHLPDIQDMPGSSSQVIHDLNPSMTMAVTSNPNTTMVMTVSPPATHFVQAGTPQF